MTSKASVFSGAILRHLLSNQRFARHKAVEISLSTPQPSELRPKYWARIAPRSMDNIFFAPISTSQAPMWSHAFLGHVRLALTPPACILPAWKRVAVQNMAISLAHEALGNFDMLAVVVVNCPSLSWEADPRREKAQPSSPPLSDFLGCLPKTQSMVSERYPSFSRPCLFQPLLDFHPAF